MDIGIACGGTGGHLIPGVVMAEEMKRRGHRVTLWISGREAERRSLGGWDGPLRVVAAGGLPSGFGVKTLAALWRLAQASATCRRTMAAERPDALLAMGGYASVGPALAARRLRVPIVLHEQNVVPGRAVSWLSRLAALTAISFEETRPYLPRVRVEHTGLPIRPVSSARFDDAPPGWAAGGFTLLAMGGSQGAHAINDLCAEAVRRLHGEGVPIRVIHLTGSRDEDAIRAVYETACVPHRVFGFLAQMPKAYGAADFAVSRAGANSCLELAAYGVPALLVPYPFAMRDHQTANARAMARIGGADWRAQKELTGDGLRGYLAAIARDEAKRRAMREALRGADAGHAASRLADAVERVAVGD
jgi:UDP-N-acetylglucosamine--N-acetylmuramyl-(pentapeptide) pyrophosphoryl-undecaprenol N-acetylglucosamine transferase